MGDADSPQEPVKPSIENGKEQNQEPVTENSMTDDSSQKPTNKAGVYLVIGVLIVITAAVILSKFPIPADWVGMATSEEKSQVATEEVDGRIIKTTTTIKTEPAKTLWDWMSLLLAPATLAGLGFVFQSSQERAKAAREKVEKRAEVAAKERADEQAQAEKDRADKQAQAEKDRADEQAKAEKDRAEDRLRADALEAYINSISDLLVGKRLSVLAKQKARGLLMNTDQDLLDAGMDVIRASTLSILRRFTDYNDSKRTDGDRKGSVLVFLYETGLISNQKEYERGQEDTVAKNFPSLLSLSSADLSDANLRGADFYKANLSHTNLSRANLSGATICLANLYKTKLSDADLRGADLSHTNLDQADLRGTNLNDALFWYSNFYEANLNGAKLSPAYLHCANLYKANLSDADLGGADLYETKLIYTDLSRANLSGAILIYTDLSGANLSGATLSDAILLSVDLSSVRPGTLTQEQLEGEKQPLLCKVKLPHNIKADPQRLTSDYKILPEALLKRCPEDYAFLATAQSFVDGVLNS